jgi:hypothetical protein
MNSLLLSFLFISKILPDIYVIYEDNDIEDLFKLDKIDGIYLRLYWDKLEIHQNDYNFTELINAINLSNIYNKHLSISIRAGSNSPLWIKYNNSLEFITGPHNDICENITIPIPWKEEYITSFEYLLNNVTDVILKYDIQKKISIIKITGINEKTEEFRLPSSDSTTILKNCVLSNDTKIWESVGYKSEYILNTFNIFFNIFKDMKYKINSKLILTLEILGNNAFPFKDNNITEYVINKYKDIDVIQWDGLNSIEQASIMYSIKKPIAWQTNQFLGLKRGTGCLSQHPKDSIECNTLTYYDLLLQGINGTYIEIWQSNINLFQTLNSEF